jgi:non-ribosomal peptide synthetase component E (peptide arylation enzyme)
VVPQPGQAISLDDLTDYLRQQGLAIFKLPERLIEVDALPMNATGKVLRAELRKQFEA